MSLGRLTWMVCLLCCLGAAQAAGLQPFVAEYEVLVDGKPAGESRIELSQAADGRWLHTLRASGTRGLARLARFQTEQNGLFELHEAQLRLLSAQMSSRSVIRDRELAVQFDWVAGTVEWQGDIEDDQPAQRPLTGLPATGSALNLLLAFAADLPSGQVVHYVLHDRGKATVMDYEIQPIQTLEVPLGTFQAVALRGERNHGQRISTAWYARELPPTPLRMLQTEHGRPKYELRLRAISTATAAAN